MVLSLPERAFECRIETLHTHVATQQQRKSKEDDVVVICATGDLLLRVPDSFRGAKVDYRVSSALLKDNSPYFDRLLDSEKFSEGAAFNARLADLKDQFGGISSVPVVDLPVIDVEDAGQFPSHISNIDTLKHFFSVLHRMSTGDLSSHKPSAFTRQIALLAIVADRFNATQIFLNVLTDKGYIRQWRAEVDGKLPIKHQTITSPKSLRELLWRQQIFAGALLGVKEWVSKYSKFLILAGSRQWRDKEPDTSTNTGHTNPDDGPWWYLPLGLEEELRHRRTLILQALSSLLTHFLSLYTSPTRQCRLGYDSSSQCDAFQLGEMTRFLLRKGLFSLTSDIISPEASETHSACGPYQGSILRLLDLLRECSSYQIDKFHLHCGLRSRLVPMVGFLERVLVREDGVGVCLQCWRGGKEEENWMGVKRGVWRYKDWNEKLVKEERTNGVRGCGAYHDVIREICTAAVRDWSTAD